MYHRDTLIDMYRVLHMECHGAWPEDTSHLDNDELLDRLNGLEVAVEIGTEDTGFATTVVEGASDPRGFIHPEEYC